MSDAKTAAERADSSAREAEQTDEQLWDDLEAKAKTEGDADPDAEPAEVDDDAQAKAKDDEPEDDEPEEEPSEDTDEDEAPADAPAGTDPEALEAQVKRLQHALNSEKGRTAASRREIESLRRRISAAEKAQRDNPDDADLKARKEKLAAAKEEYGDVIGPLTDHIAALESRLDRLSAQEARELKAQKAQYAELVAAERGVFETEHPDGFETIIAHREAFDDWIEDQPKRLRDIYAANERDIVDGNSAAFLVTRFKQALLEADGGPAPAEPSEDTRLQTRRQRQLAGARSSRNPSRQQASSRPAKDSDDAQAHWDYFERVDRGG